ncbi:unnamed protein product [Candida verbasci]|uniref:RING-type domain-containing protein n=1 Tax=Candida verbasci TaxID=1227364 RepID=A0A9W4TV91_9ASCO|nr:unnamed protein product [Candida verbasci]
MDSIECSICLDEIALVDEVGIIPCCKSQIYHKNCIFTWSNKFSNCCPTCRSNFQRLEIYKNYNLENVVEIINIPDKLKPKKLQERTTQNIQFSNFEGPSINTSSSSNICCICALTIRYNNQSNILCQHCGCNFHINCLGGFPINEDEEYNWYCPMCDFNNQESMISYPRRTTVLSGLNKKKAKNSLVVHNLNNEIDDDFLYPEEEMITSTSTVINGGVISRRETKELANLTPDEITSWDIFEKIRTNQSAEIVRQEEAPKEQHVRRKRKKITPLKNTQPLIIPKSQGPSRINELMNPSNMQKQSNSYSTSNSNSNPQSPNSNSPMESITYSSSDDGNNEYVLSVDQKNTIQNLIRHKLMSKYSDNSDLINNEERFINRILNKVITVLSNANNIDEYFNNNEKMDSLIDLYVS